MRFRFFKFSGLHIYKSFLLYAETVCDVFGRIELYGHENVPRQPCILVANHVSFLDPLAMGFFHETRMCALARDTLFKGPVLGWIFRNLNAVPVKRGESGNLGAFRDVLARVKNGDSIMIFPEGTRSPDGKLMPGKGGAGLLAIKAGVPILPVRSFKFEEVLPRSNRLRGGTRIAICAGKPIDPKEIDPGKGCTDRAQVIVDRIMERIAAIEPPRFNEL